MSFSKICLAFAFLNFGYDIGHAEPLYITSLTPPTSMMDPDLVFQVAYFAEVRNRISISVSTTPGKDGSPPTPAATTATIENKPVPLVRAFLYSKKNAFFSDTISITAGADGMLTNSDTASSQQVTAILTELAQAAAAIEGLAAPLDVTPPPKSKDIRQSCKIALSNLTSSAPFIARVEKSVSQGRHELYQSPDKSFILSLAIEIPIISGSKATVPPEGHPGFVFFYPVAATGTLLCSIKDAKNKFHSIALTLPLPLNLYIDSAYIDPQRDFFTNPQDTITLSEGFLVSHKYVAQSAAKTVVDTITLPIKALMPSVSVQQTTTVQPNGSATVATQRTVGPPKSP